MNSTPSSQVKTCIHKFLYCFLANGGTSYQSDLTGVKYWCSIITENKIDCYTLLECDIIIIDTDISKEPTALMMEVRIWDVLLSS
jgi:hypothetical protein